MTKAAAETNSLLLAEFPCHFVTLGEHRPQLQLHRPANEPIGNRRQWQRKSDDVSEPRAAILRQKMMRMAPVPERSAHLLIHEQGAALALHMQRQPPHLDGTENRRQNLHPRARLQAPALSGQNLRPRRRQQFQHAFLFMESPHPIHRCVDPGTVLERQH